MIDVIELEMQGPQIRAERPGRDDLGVRAVPPAVIGLEPLPDSRSRWGRTGQMRNDDDLELRVRDRTRRRGSVGAADRVDDPEPLPVELDLGSSAAALGLDQGHAHSTSSEGGAMAALIPAQRCNGYQAAGLEARAAYLPATPCTRARRFATRRRDGRERP
jgi:hypothetical protein